ncbi:RNA polymerase II holoenzyme cyclin-like subunit [Xylographa opegraphella]|nr:RNA polymerase II holoenzyme cyclin-like subunit [Xylographa opegraphella]
MAANYWASTQRLHWQFTRDELSEIRDSLEENDRHFVQQFALPDRRHLHHWFTQELAKFVKKLGIRQQAIATAQIYLRRFYLKVEIRRTNPILVMTTALYLACKMEECPQHIRVIVSEARNLWPDFIVSDISKVGECEFFLISEMNCQLIVHQPYRTLSQLQTTLKLSKEEVEAASNIINDHYETDVPLLYPPHVVAVTAIFLVVGLNLVQSGLRTANSANSATTAVHALNESGPSSVAEAKKQHLVKWLADGEVDIKSMMECTQEIISLYECLEQYDRNKVKEQIARFVKARGLEK